jgi:hypothetical protein
MFRLLNSASMAGFVLAVATTLAVAQEVKAEVTPKVEEPKEVKIIKSWKGSVADEKLPQPECIVSTKELEAVWKAWKVETEVPKVDFTKNLVVASYTRGSLLNITRVTLDDKGNLKSLGIATSDFGPGIRYVLNVVSREDVKAVNGKELPKE